MKVLKIETIVTQLPSVFQLPPSAVLNISQYIIIL